MVLGNLGFNPGSCASPDLLVLSLFKKAAKKRGEITGGNVTRDKLVVIDANYCLASYFNVFCFMELFQGRSSKRTKMDVGIYYYCY